MSPSGTRDSELSLERRKSVVAHYERQLREHGPTARGMDWKDEASQQLRFDVLCNAFDLDGLSVHEIGAGAGHFFDHLRRRGIDAQYSGSDLSSSMVETAQRLHPGVEFELRDVTAEPDERRYDIVLCSGLFHVKLEASDDEWRRFVESGLRRMFEICRVGIAFNMMSDQVDYHSDLLYYSNPGSIVDFCRRELSRHVAMRHDYLLHEYTVYVHRQPTLR